MAHEHAHHGHHPPDPPPSTERVLDPVCGMSVNPATAKGGSLDHGGHTYYFCNPRCRERFAADPAKYLPAAAPATTEAEAPAPARSHGVASAPPAHAHPAPPSAKAAPSGTVYVCPMDPEVREDSPGPCPKCGMALEPEQPRTLTRTEWV